jgi:hypothetical protein
MLLQSTEHEGSCFLQKRNESCIVKKAFGSKEVGAWTQKILYPAQKTCESIFSMR